MTFEPQAFKIPGVVHPPPPRYTYLAADLRGGQILDELPLTGVSFGRELNGSGTFRGSLPLGDPDIGVRNPRLVTQPAKTAIYVDRDGVLIWGGIIWTRRYDSGHQVLEIAGADFASYFDHRYVLPAVLPSKLASAVVGFDAIEQNEIARSLVNLAQQATGGDIGIELPMSTSEIYRDRHYHGYDLQSVGDALENLANVINGPDFLFDVYWGADNQPHRRLVLGTPRLGQQGTERIFELGANVTSYSVDEDGAAMTTRDYATGAGEEEATPIAVAENPCAYDIGWPLLEDEEGYSTVETLGTLQEHADADLITTRLPLVHHEVTARADREPYVGTYAPGDDMRLIIPAGDPYYSDGLDQWLRILAYDCQPGDDAGRDEVKLTVSDTLGAT